jgi:hypothetical protein
MENTDFPPQYEKNEDGTTVYIDQDGFEAWVMYDSPFGPDVKISQPMSENAHILGLHKHGLPPFAIEHTMTSDPLCAFWSVLTVALNELCPGYVANRLRELEGAEVARQEA